MAALAAYFGLALVPKWWPGFGGTLTFFVYFLSIPVVLLVLLGLAVWGVVGAIVSRIRGRSLRGRHRALVILPLTGFLMFGSVILLAPAIRGALPTGSYLLEFDAAVWQDPSSAEFVEGDITPRQKMLGSLVESLAPGQGRAELEALLGPSLETPYFASTGRHLIYVLGPERDAFFGLDSEWLLIWLDASGHFVRYRISTD